MTLVFDQPKALFAAAEEQVPKGAAEHASRLLEGEERTQCDEKDRGVSHGEAIASREAGPTPTWLWTELKRLGLSVICIDARHARAVLKMQTNKSDRNDAAGIARIMQTGWFRDVDSHSIRALMQLSTATQSTPKRTLQ